MTRSVQNLFHTSPYTLYLALSCFVQVAQIASAMAAIGVQPRQRIGVFGPNSPDWMMAMQVGIVVAFSVHSTVGGWHWHWQPCAHCLAGVVISDMDIHTCTMKYACWDNVDARTHYVHIRMHAHTRTHTHTRSCTHTHTHTHTHAHAHACTHTCTHMRARTHARMHASPSTRTPTLSQAHHRATFFNHVNHARLA